MNSHLFSIISFGPTIVGLILVAVIVGSKNYKSKVNMSFIIWVLNILAYITLNFVTRLPSNLSDGLMWTRAALAVANFIPLTFYYFSRCLTRNKTPSKWYDYAIYTIPFLMIPTSFLSSNIVEVTQSNYGLVLSKTGPLLFLTIFYFVFAFYFAYSQLYKFQKTATQSVRSQIKLISISSGAIIVINLTSQIILPKFGFYNIGNIVGNPSILIFVGAVGYSIIRHKLFDIRSTAIRSLIFTITIAASIVVIIFLIITPFHYIFKDIKLTIWPEIYLINVSLLMALSYGTFKKALVKATDKVFYRNGYDPEIVLSRIGRVLASEILLDNMSQKIKTIIETSLRVSQVDIIVLNKNQIFYEAGNFFVKVHDELSNDLASLGDNILIFDELDDGQTKLILDKYGIDVFVPLTTSNERNGYLILSHKLNGTAYDLEDIKLIDNIRSELSIAIANSRSYSQIQQFNSSLQTKIQQATADLTRANEELKKQDSVKDDFISMISHQLGTPLAVMDGFLTLVVQGFYGKPNEKMQDALEKTLSRTRNMKGLVFDLLNISRMTAGKFFLEISDVDLAKVVAEEIEELQRQAHDRNVKLNYHPPEHNIPTLKIDEPKTRQAILNLINNAIFYSPNGTVEVYLDSDETNVIFKVIDTGIGVPEEEKAHLFTKFFRAENARKESPNGTGIGLYLVKRVITDQHGRLIFSSQVGKGSVFGFMLPIGGISVPASPSDISTHKTVNMPMSDDEKLVNYAGQKPVEESIVTQDPNLKDPTIKS